LAESYCAVSAVRVFRTDERGSVRDLLTPHYIKVSRKVQLNLSQKLSIFVPVSKSSTISV